MKHYNYWTLALLMASAMTACNDISVSDVDTEIGIAVNDLEIPLNVEAIELRSLLDVDGNERVKIVNDEYAVVVEGSFNSEVIHVDKIVVPAQHIDGVKDKMEKSRPVMPLPASSRASRAAMSDMLIAYYSLPSTKSMINAYVDRIDAAIRSLQELKGSTSFEFDVNIDPENRLLVQLASLHLENLTLKVPCGISGTISITNAIGGEAIASYSTQSGIATFSAPVLLSSAVAHVRIVVDGFDENLLKKSFSVADLLPAPVTRAATGDEGGTFSMQEEIGIESGHISVYLSDFRPEVIQEAESKLPEGTAGADREAQLSDALYSALDTELPIETSAKMEDIVISEISGIFDYKVQDIAVNGIDLSDVPDVLTQQGTDIRLENPQIYITLANPIVDGAKHTVNASSLLTLTTEDAQGVTRKFDLTNRINVTQPNNKFCLSPHPVAKPFAGYEGAAFIEFESLSGILDTSDGTENSNGLPKKISISVVDTRVKDDNVTNLPLGQDYEIEGVYTFFAPLSMKEGSSIKYADNVDGWSKDTEGINVQRLNLKAEVSSNVPLELAFKIIPVDNNGRVMNATCSTMVIPANASNVPVEMNIQGNFFNLDGIRIEAEATSKDGKQPLSPSMKIQLNHLRVRVTGSYNNEL